MNFKPNALNLIIPTVFFISIALFVQAQCPDRMYALGIGGSSYSFYNDTASGDLCLQTIPASIQLQDANNQCGPVLYSGSGSCLQNSGSASPPFVGKSYVENDPNCSIAQNTAPFIVSWGSCNCSYFGTFPNYVLQAEDCSGSSCTPALNIPDNPIPNGLYKASINITSTGVVSSSSTVDFESGGVICLESGFTTTISSNFSAKIVNCQ